MLAPTTGPGVSIGSRRHNALSKAWTRLSIVIMPCCEQSLDRSVARSVLWDSLGRISASYRHEGDLHRGDLPTRSGGRLWQTAHDVDLRAASFVTSKRTAGFTPESSIEMYVLRLGGLKLQSEPSFVCQLSDEAQKEASQTLPLYRWRDAEHHEVIVLFLQSMLL